MCLPSRVRSQGALCTRCEADWYLLVPIRFRSKLSRRLNYLQTIDMLIGGAYEKFLLVHDRDALPWPNLLVHDWLRESRLVKFIVSPVPITISLKLSIKRNIIDQRRYTRRSTTISFKSWVFNIKATIGHWIGAISYGRPSDIGTPYQVHERHLLGW